MRLCGLERPTFLGYDDADDKTVDSKNASHHDRHDVSHHQIRTHYARVRDRQTGFRGSICAPSICKQKKIEYAHMPKLAAVRRFLPQFTAISRRLPPRAAIDRSPALFNIL